MSSTATPNFWKTAFLYGFPAGLFIVAVMLGSFALFGVPEKASGLAMVFGFLVIIVITVGLFGTGMKRYRGAMPDRLFSFGRALGLGLVMAFFSALAYMLSWELAYPFFGDHFYTTYFDNMQSMQLSADGLTDEKIAEIKAATEKMKTDYARRGFRMPMTFMENFPVGAVFGAILALFMHNPKFWARGGK